MIKNLQALKCSYHYCEMQLYKHLSLRLTPVFKQLQFRHLSQCYLFDFREPSECSYIKSVTTADRLQLQTC